MKVDKTLVASVALHVLVIGWGLVSFSSKAFEAIPEESLPVDIISADQLAKVTAGMKSGKKENPKPLVEKVAEAKPPVDDTVGKITEKAPVVTDTAPPPQPKPEEKPVEKKPDPPKPVVENKPKEEPKPIEKKPDPPKIDPIAEALANLLEERRPAAILGRVVQDGRDGFVLVAPVVEHEARDRQQVAEVGNFGAFPPLIAVHAVSKGHRVVESLGKFH